MSKKQIAQATAIIVVFSLFGKLLGFVREMVIAAIFGTTYRTDAYFIGLTGPDFIREVISGGVLTAVFIPVYTACQSKNDPQQTKTTLNTVATLLLIAMALSVIVGIPLAPYLVRVIAPEIDPATFTIAVQITRIIFPATVFMGLANFYGSLLNVQKHFVSPALAQIMLNIGIIGGLLLWGSKWGVNSLALGFLGGAALQFVIILPALRSNEVRFRPQLEWTPDISKMISLWVPLFFASFVSTANDLVSRSLAAGLEPGNVAAINFANRIRETIWLLCGVPLGTAIFPYLSSHAANGEQKELEKLIFFSIRLTAFMALPISFLLLFYSEPIIRILFQRGMFNASSTQITSSALTYYSIGALFYALNYVVLKVYYSIHDPIKPLKAFGIAFLINIVLGIVLRKYLSVGGIALARSLADMFSFGYLFFSLSGNFKEFKFSDVYAPVLKIVTLSLLSVAISYLIYLFLPAANGVIPTIINVGIAWSSCIACYVGFGFVMKLNEVNSLLNIVRKKAVL